MKRVSIYWLIMLVLAASCEQKPSSIPSEKESNASLTGKLFIIGGGARPPQMIRSMIQAAGIREGGSLMILPWASEEPDSACFYATRQFLEAGIPDTMIHCFPVIDDRISQEDVERLSRARLIYISGGDQQRFMQQVEMEGIKAAILESWKRGGMIAGTSAGAAVMSRKMISGRQFNHPEYTGDFRVIEAENIELTEGLGLLENVIIDQHFIWRMRMNRLISAVIESPGLMGIGIDESTAILVEGDSARVIGNSQVIVLENPQGHYSVRNKLLGATDLRLGVYLPGQSFSLPH